MHKNFKLSSQSTIYFLDACGLSLIAIEKWRTLSTPNFPLPYKTNLTCTWTINTMSSNYTIKLITGSISDDSCCEQVSFFFLQYNF